MEQLLEAPQETSVSAAQPCPVWSCNEWDPLEEVIVGVADGACVPPWDVSIASAVPERHHAFFKANAGRSFPRDRLDAAARELDDFSALLEREGITVRRPEMRDHGEPFAAPGWRSTGLYDAMPRDVLLAVGDQILECPLAWRSRYFGLNAFRALMKGYFRAGARWTAAPKPELADALYNHEWREPAPGQAPAPVITEFEPVFDAADFIRCGRDIFAQLSTVTNAFGVEWLRRQLGPDYTIHVLAFDDPHPMHIDATFMPVAPGKVVINPERVPTMPAMFKDWEALPAPPPVTPDAHPLYMTSKWINMNVLMLDPERMVVEAQDEPMIEAARRWGFEPVPVAFRNFNSLGGSFHCATLDVRRAGTLTSYF